LRLLYMLPTFSVTSSKDLVLRKQTSETIVAELLQDRGLFYRHCHKIYLMICLRTIATKKLRYPMMIIRHVLSECTEHVLNNRKICHS